jgi:hypothetical protein
MSDDYEMRLTRPLDESVEVETNFRIVYAVWSCLFPLDLDITGSISIKFGCRSRQPSKQVITLVEPSNEPLFSP